jgi:hypothetical protein
VDLTPLAQVISQLRSSVSGLKLNPSFPLLQTELLSQPVSAAAIKRSALDIINAAFGKHPCKRPKQSDTDSHQPWSAMHYFFVDEVDGAKYECLV